MIHSQIYDLTLMKKTCNLDFWWSLSSIIKGGSKFVSKGLLIQRRNQIWWWGAAMWGRSCWYQPPLIDWKNLQVLQGMVRIEPIVFCNPVMQGHIKDPAVVCSMLCHNHRAKNIHRWCNQMWIKWSTSNSNILQICLYIWAHTHACTHKYPPPLPSLR